MKNDTLRLTPRAGTVAAISALLLTTACGTDINEFEGAASIEAKASTAEDSTSGEQSLTAKYPTAPLSCTQNNDCLAACVCGSTGQCQNSGVGPVPPAGFCNQAPVRSCTQNSDCRDTCNCDKSGHCSQPRIGPPPPYEACHLPPPDQYEVDDQWPDWKPYQAQPQVHSFHTAGDRDWIAVYFGFAGNYRFETFNLRYRADTKIKVFEFNAGTKGDLVGVHDDVGGWWWDEQSKRSVVDLQVPANSSYLIKVVNKSPAFVYTDYVDFPEYEFKITRNN